MSIIVFPDVIAFHVFSFVDKVKQIVLANMGTLQPTENFLFPLSSPPVPHSLLPLYASLIV